jgi:hypothetical protein
VQKRRNHVCDVGVFFRIPLACYFFAPFMPDEKEKRPDCSLKKKERRKKCVAKN